ncbi:hypothetical protein M3212_09560 [Alkalihalobacillus oceani]|uniref:hypothetical protein n=1 Tax=Halalkalibacter oceani TaxID=1653776 RepID=UPI00203B1A15|nr:hypothetical protein [Halalkalibacter oceani]MCM3761030.1 hypothetical protein [Halalkalibacter oceani]
MIRIYRKADLEIVGSCPTGVSVEDEIRLNVIPNFGGVPEDYEALWVDKQPFHLEKVGEDIVVVEDVPTFSESPDPDKVILFEAIANLFEEVQLLKNQLGGGDP